MEIFSKIIAGYLAGLSVGVFCLGLCLPVFLPVLLSEKRSGKGIINILLEFSLGRLIGYLFFGLIFGWFGQVIQNTGIHLIVTLSNIWLGVLLIIFGLGMINMRYCALVPFKKVKWPLLLGFLTGVNVCPPFIASLTYVFNLRDVFLSLLYFAMFFLGTSTYIIPASILGFATRSKWAVKIAHISSIVAGLFFVVSGFLSV